MSVRRTLLAFSVATIIGPAGAMPAHGQDALPESLTCRCNAKSKRDYEFLSGNRWEGGSFLGLRFPFMSGTVSGRDFSLRDKVFSGLQTDAPTVRSISPATEGKEAESVEFSASVLMRSGGDTVFLTWTNDMNKTWMAVVDMAHRKAVVTHVYYGVTSTGGEVETLDCR